MASKLSIALCSYNGERFIGDQLESIAAQTRLPDELIVCDDESTDGTMAIVEAFTARAPFPVVRRVNERNLGSNKNFERAIELCSGDVIALCDQDDVWHRDKLARIEAELGRSPDVGFVFGDAELIDEQSQALGRTLWQSYAIGREWQRRVTSAQAFDVLLGRSTVTGATMAFRARYRELALELPADLTHDGWIALMIGAVAPVALIREPLMNYRRHAGQQLGVPERAPERNTMGGDLPVLRRVLDRLLDRRDRFDTSVAVARLEARLAHMEARARLPEGFRRIGVVARELATRRYHAYSNGVPGAIKDLLDL